MGTIIKISGAIAIPLVWYFLFLAEQWLAALSIGVWLIAEAMLYAERRKMVAAGNTGGGWLFALAHTALSGLLIAYVLATIASLNSTPGELAATIETAERNRDAVMRLLGGR